MFSQFYIYIIFQSSQLYSFILVGVQMTEILMSHLINQFTAMIGQTALVFICMLLIFNIPCHGSLTLAICITFLQSFVGMSFGKYPYYCIYPYFNSVFSELRFTDSHSMRQ